MAEQNKIDNIAAQIARQTDILQQELVRDLLKLSKAAVIRETPATPGVFLRCR